jgi:hypothetical protein
MSKSTIARRSILKEQQSDLKMLPHFTAQSQTALSTMDLAGEPESKIVPTYFSKTTFGSTLDHLELL